MKKIISASLLAMTMVATLAMAQIGAKDEGEKLDTQLRNDAKTGFVCVRQASLRRSPSLDENRGRGTKDIAFGAKLEVLQVGEVWVKVREPGDRKSHWMHRAALCGDQKVIVAMRQTGLVPHWVMSVFEEAGEERMTFVGGNVAVSLSEQDRQQLKPGDNGTAEVRNITPSRFHAERGDCIWFGPSDGASDRKEFPLKSFGIARPLRSPRHSVHYAFDGKGNVLLLADLLARELAAFARESTDMLAIRCPPEISSAPRDIFWAESLGYVVADAEKGVLFLSAHPVHGVSLDDSIVRAGQRACLVGIHKGLLLTAWIGSKNELVLYGSKEGGSYRIESVVEIPGEPVCFLTVGRRSSLLFVGTREGRLLSVDTDKRTVVGNMGLCGGGIASLLLNEETLWAACGNDGLVTLSTSDPAQPKLDRRLAGLAPADAILHVSEEKEDLLLLGGRKKGGVRLYHEPPTPKLAGIVSGSEGTMVRSLAVGQVTGGTALTVRDAPRIVVAGSVGSELQIFTGATYRDLALSHSVPISCRKSAWGSQLLACVSGDSLTFVSLSEILPPTSGGIGLSIHGGAQVDFRGGSLQIVRGDAHGIVAVDTFSAFRRSDAWTDSPTTGKMMTIVQRGDSLLAIGDFELRRGEMFLFRPGIVLTVGKGGAVLAGDKYSAGDVLTLSRTGTPTKVGRWRGLQNHP